MDELEKVLDDLWMTAIRFCERPSSELPMRLPGNLEQESHGGLEYIAEAKRRINATRACEIAEAVKPWREVLSNLVEKLTLVHDDPRYMRVWEIAQNHTGVPYSGPQYVVELNAARALLDKAGK